ncbi:cytochrome P450 [Mycobacterium attenuatum]|uniref:Bifunctional cytochrome P450/NADPH--P450 reductase n=1 Tax=Mycobacterium attenuatum TaxID=2341086 RepID=A0A498QHT2_9MYCO|nr:cytochrome P450 [Mycobacterium attenuatum]VBA44479.1 Bifunctional cytochrome P450/NADPH--P450 reductase [Mycobacterium attenuatum]VBA59708.1 Bifunctional cytochrome P450/NADPH--P450 reductase [Mycobacterium attenuatum]
MTTDSSIPTSQLNRFQFPIIADPRTLDFTKPVQAVTTELRKLGSGMLEQPFGNQPVIFLADTALIDEVNDETRWEKHIGPSLGRLRSVLGDGLFTAYNHEPNWRTAHNILMPLFAKAAMKRYHDNMIGAIRELLDTWNTKSAVRGWLTIPADTNRLTLEIIARTAMGHSFSKLSNPRERENPFVAMLIRELAYADRHTTDIPQDRKNQHNKDKAEMRRQVATIIEARNSTPDSHTDVLDVLLQRTDPDTGEQLGNDNIINQILTLLIVGSETSANAIAFALHLLATHPDIAAKARAEIDERWPDKIFPNIGFEDVATLRYLRCVVDETLRLWPAAPGYFRQARQDTTIGNGKHAFRAGDWVFVHLIAAHRCDAWGSDADEFNPDRFLPENLRKLPPRTYKPFGTGARACLGRQFALHETLLTLAAVLHQYDLEPRPGYHLSASEAMTLKPVDLQLRLHRR